MEILCLAQRSLVKPQYPCMMWFNVSFTAEWMALLPANWFFYPQEVFPLPLKGSVLRDFLMYFFCINQLHLGT
jgi:hypothetical protein